MKSLAKTFTLKTTFFRKEIFEPRLRADIKVHNRLSLYSTSFRNW